MLDSLPNLSMLHDRNLPRTRANIDHLVVAPLGVWVIDAKRYKGRIERRQTGFMGTGPSQLFVGRRNQSKLIDGMHRQVDAVRHVLKKHDVRVSGALCFIDGDWPLLAQPFTVDGVAVHYPTSLRRALGGDGPLSSPARADLAGLLDEHFRPSVREAPEGASSRWDPGGVAPTCDN